VTALNEQERLVVATIRAFVDDEVRPVVRELEHANEYPEKLIQQMKELVSSGRPSVRSTADSGLYRLLRPHHLSARARLDEPGRSDGRA